MAALIAGTSVATLAQERPTAIAAPVIVVVPEAPQRLICKSSVETGSLIRQHRTCLTARQWRYVNDESQRGARDMVDSGRAKPGSN